MRPHSLFAVPVIIALLLTGCGSPPIAMNNIAPADTPPNDHPRYDLNGNYTASGRSAMIVSTTGAPAVRAGAEVLEEGGSAADAALTTALGQVVLSGGSWVSYAGILTMVYYDAADGTITSLHAGYTVPSNETDPLTIPESGTPSGRTALVPGFMAGVQAAHDCFGKLPFGRIFAPAITFAAKGFTVYPALESCLYYRRYVLTRLPATRKIFTNRDGRLYRTGDLFRQPELAATLRQVADQGAAYMYTGPWAERFVAAVRNEGGRVTRRDLADYRVRWSRPLHTRYRGYDVHALGLPDTGGVNIIEGLHLLEQAHPAVYGHYTESPQALYRLIQATRVAPFFTFLPDYHKKLQARLPGTDFSLAGRTRRHTAAVLWEQIESGKWSGLQEEILADLARGSSHSDAIVARDRFGNVAAVLHSINTGLWGTTGITVDGVTIPDSACFQQELMAAAGPGNYLPNRSTPLLVFKEGKCVLAASAVGNGLHEVSLQNLHNLLDFQMDIHTAVNTPNFYTPDWDEMEAQTVLRGTFAKPVLKGIQRLGQPIRAVHEDDAGLFTGTWIGMTIDPETGIIQAAIPGDNLLYRAGHAQGF